METANTTKLMTTKQEYVVKQEHDVPLGIAVEKALANYFVNLGDESTTDLYKIVRDEVEEALLRFVMDHKKIRKNQSKAAILLGLSRTTLRKKLKQYDML